MDLIKNHGFVSLKVRKYTFKILLESTQFEMGHHIFKRTTNDHSINNA